MSALKHAAALRRDPPASRLIPYTAHVSPHVIRTRSADFVQVFRLLGASFETADDEQLNTAHERLNVLWRNIASPQIALWTHLIRRRQSTSVLPGDDPGFAAALAAKYGSRLSKERLMINELYLSVVYRPTADVATSLASKFLAKVRPDSGQAELKDALDACEKLSQGLLASLERYEPERLGAYEDHGRLYSSALEFLGLLINGEWQPQPLPRAAVDEALATGRLFFGTEAIEYRLPTRTRVGAMLGIKEYPTPSVVGMYDRLLSAPFPFVVTQSFTFLSKSSSQSLLQRQFNRLANAGDFAVSQAEELKGALDALTSNEFVMGDHHFSMQVFWDDTERECADLGTDRLKSLNKHLALARSYLADTGMTVAREDLALEAAFWAQLPGHFYMRPRKAPITSRNFCAMTGFHNYPTGREQGNHWGDALAVLITSARSPYHFSLHASDPSDPAGGSRKDTGHTFICGPTGSGKTVFIGFLIALLARQGVTQVVIDKDRGLEILVRALGGEYLPLRNGVPTGFNPLQLPTTPQHVEFLKCWLRMLVRRGGEHSLSVREQSDLDQALHGTLALQRSARRLSRLIEFTDATDPEGIHARLSKWCECAGGDYAWAFDCREDSIVPHFAAHHVLGFDVTEFLAHEVTRAPMTFYLFHLIRGLLDGRRLVCWLDEFWRLLADPAFEGFAKDGPKTWRKLNGVMCLATQSASDVLLSPISRTIVEQTPTKVFFPNPEADPSEYIRGFGLTEREFRLIKEQLAPGSRQFLIKQGHHSVACQLDLRGFEAELNVISGRAESVLRMERLITQVGHDPGQWLPRFEKGEDSCR